MITNSKYLGKAHALQSLGFTEDQIKVAFVREGLDADIADDLVKVAIWGAIGKGIKGVGMAAKAIKGMGATKALGQGANMAASWGGQGRKSGTLLGKMQAQLGFAGGRASRGLQQGLLGLQKAPGKTMWEGTKNFGKGFMFMPSATGMAGTAGRATSVGAMVAPMFSSPQQQQYRPMSGGY